MKRWLIIGAVVLVILVTAWGLVQRKATSLMNAQLRRAVGKLVSNPQHLQLTNAPIQLIGANKARIPRLEITGAELQLPRSAKVTAVKITVRDIEVTVGNTPGITHVGAGTFEVMLTAADVTDFVRKQSSLKAETLTMRAETFSVTLARQTGATFIGEGETVAGRRVPIMVTGQFTPDSATGGIALHPTRMTVARLPVGSSILHNACLTLPLREYLGDRFNGAITEVITTDGAVTVRGAFDGTALLAK